MRTEIEFFRPPYSSCNRETTESDYFKHYTRDQCLFECLIGTIKGGFNKI